MFYFFDLSFSQRIYSLFVLEYILTHYTHTVHSFTLCLYLLVVEGSDVVFSTTNGYTETSSSVDNAKSSSISSPLFFVLGRPLPTNLNLPLGFDIGLRGMCIGEKRRIKLPSTLGYDAVKKFENVHITPLDIKTVVVNKYQPLILDATLLSINGVAESESVGVPES